jgi:anti-anti-sigma factor
MSSVHRIETGGPLFSCDVTRLDDPAAGDRVAIGVEVIGGIDRPSAGQFRNQLLTLAKEHPASITIDMRNVAVLDSACVAVLVEVWRFTQDHGIELAVLSPAASIRQVFDVAASGRIVTLRA